MRALALFLSAILTPLAGQGLAQAPSQQTLSVLLLDGQNNHDGPRTSALLQGALARAAHLKVSTATTPKAGAKAEEWASFQPDLAPHQVIVLNYNGDAWPPAFQARFLQWIESGGGVVAVHASNNPFADWGDYDRLIGLGWRGKEHGRGAVVDDATGVLRFVDQGTGRGAGHGQVHPFRVTTRHRTHPITAGLPRVWMHGADELYHGQRGPAEGMELLLSAWSDPEKGGTGEHEPVAWWTSRGKGRFVTTLLGHLWRGQTDESALRCAGFQTFLIRSVEWAGHSPTMSPLPPDFPGPDQVVTRPDASK